MSPPQRLDDLRSELEVALVSSGHPAPSDPDGSGLFQATVAGTSGDDVVLELGPREQGMIPLAEFDEPPAPGTTLAVVLRGREDGLWLFSLRDAKRISAWKDMEVGSLVKGKVIGVNKGGLELKVEGVRAFLPLSQLELTPVEDPLRYADETLVCEVMEIDREKKSLVVSRRKVLENEIRRRRQETAETLEVGAVVRGRVSRMESYGAFVELVPGIEGLLHVSNLSHRRVAHPEEMLSIGQEVEVQILEIQEGGRRIGLGMKQLEADPWDGIDERLHAGQILTGTVRRLADFGAFVEVLPGVEGLVHVSEADVIRVRHVKEVLKVGEEVSVRVISVDPNARRLSLSRKTERGALIGSDEALEGADLEEAVRGQQETMLGTNLGALFKKALKKED